MDFQKLRKEHENAGVRRSELGPDPIHAFRCWFQLAVDHSPGPWFETNAMNLSTSDGTGQVTARVVLLKGVDDDGFRFFTNYESIKGRQLKLSPSAALTFHWPYLGRQVRIEGSVTKTTHDVSDEYFHSRPRGSQIAAAISRQSTEVSSREALDEMEQQASRQFEGLTVPRPDYWGGYLLAPKRIEFWQGRNNRMHDRIVYDRIEDDWKVKRLLP